jgi:hypothetical protein
LPRYQELAVQKYSCAPECLANEQMWHVKKADYDPSSAEGRQTVTCLTLTVLQLVHQGDKAHGSSAGRLTAFL